MESLLFSRYKLRVSADGDARKTVVSRVERQLSTRFIRIETSMKTKTRKGKTTRTKVKRTKLGNEPEMVECGEPERRQPKEQVQPKFILMHFGRTSSAWPRPRARNFVTNPAQPRTMGRRHMAICRLL